LAPTIKLKNNPSPRHDAEVTESRQYPPKIQISYRKTS